MTVKQMDDDLYLFKTGAGNKKIHIYFDEIEVTSTVLKLMISGEEKGRILNKKGKWFFTMTDGSSFVEIQISRDDRHDIITEVSDYDRVDKR